MTYEYFGYAIGAFVFVAGICTFLSILSNTR
jgi:hypothetical protein